MKIICKVCLEDFYTIDITTGRCLRCRLKAVLAPAKNEASYTTDIANKVFCIACRTETITADESGCCAACRVFIQKSEEHGSQPQPYYGRWNELTVEDIKFLIKCGIEVDS
jgi:hypothetical protein